MGKKQHSKDRLYLTNKEWKEEWGGNKDRSNLPYTRLPFSCCAITFTQFEDPVCTADGCVFDILNVVPYIQKYHKNPITGETLEMKDLIQLKFFKNKDNQYHCPVMHKVFTEHTHIVAIKPTGHVYCYESIEQLNIKPKNWKDLLDDTPFKKSDIINIQDPLNFKNRVVNNFEHVRCDLKVDEDIDHSCFRNLSADTMHILKGIGSQDSKIKTEDDIKKKREKAKELLKYKILKSQKRADAKVPYKPGASTWDTEDYVELSEQNKKRPKNKKEKEEVEEETKKVAKFDPNGTKRNPKEVYEPFVKYETALETTGEMSRGFTSTVMKPETLNKRKLVRIETKPKKKGYLSIITTFGNINIELHCDIVPKTCENFLGLSEMKYYNDTIFHRSIKNFMIQGGDPTGTGLGGQSIYGPTFKDEFDSRLKHDGRGVVSMANSGPHTNGSQFFICFKSAIHLDNKHSVFGKVVGGFQTLTSMEKIETDDEDHPLQEIKIERIEVYVNPFRDLEKEEEEMKLKQREAEKEAEEGEEKGLWYTDPSTRETGKAEILNNDEVMESMGSKMGIGKYMKIEKIKEKSIKMVDSIFNKDFDDLEIKIKHNNIIKKNENYGNFDNW